MDVNESLLGYVARGVHCSLREGACDFAIQLIREYEELINLLWG